MRSKNDIKNELVQIKEELESLKNKEIEMQSLVSGKEKADQTSSHLFTLLKYMIEENKTTRGMIERMYKKIESFEEEINADDLPTEPIQNGLEQGVTTIVPISELDKKIIQHIEIAGMACADDIKKAMNYKGRNAASARLNKLFKQKIIERHQLGHKVYYKYNAGKTTNGILIVSPPQ